jgi:intein-encoded DNA endonuclease-like protein
VTLKVKDVDFINAFNRELCTVLKKNLYSVIPTKSGQYQIATKVTAFTDWYIASNEEKLLEFALNYPADFVRGFADAEGSTRIKIKGGSRLVEITISNTNKKLLIAVHNALLILHIHASKIWKTSYRNKPYFAFSICSKENVKKYFKKISFNIKRKIPIWVNQKPKMSLGSFAETDIRIAQTQVSAGYVEHS